MEPWEDAEAGQYLGMVVVLIVLVTNILLGACGLLQTLQRARRLVVVVVPCWLRVMRNTWIVIMDECMEHERAMNVINLTKLFRIHGVCCGLVSVSRMYFKPNVEILLLCCFAFIPNRR